MKGRSKSVALGQTHRVCVLGFTLIELLVVIAIIAILAAILFPVFSQARAYLTADALVRLMTEMPLVIGVKQSAGDIHTLAELLANLPEGKIVLSALDDVLYPSFLLGAHGAIAGLCTAAPRLSVALWEAVQKGEHEKALQLHHQLLALHRLLNGTNFPARVKAALIAQGVPAGRPRRPLTPLDESEMERFRQLLSAPTKGTA